jgi:hypothetical protein
MGDAVERVDRETGSLPEGTPTAEGSQFLPQIDLEPSKADEVSRWLQEEINREKGSIQNLLEELAQYERLYEARPEQERRTFPWDGACNLVVPVIATAVDSVYARVMDSIFGAGDVYVSKPKSAKWVKLANPIQDFLNWVQRDILKLRAAMTPWALGALKYGTGYAKLLWEERRRNVMYKDQGGVRSGVVVTHRGPVLVPIQLYDVLLSPDAYHTQNIQTCQWIAHRTVYTMKDLKEREASGIWTNIDKVISQPRTSPTEMESESQEATKVEISEYRDYEIYECWCSFDLEGKGVLSELMVDLHLESGTPLRAIYNPYRHQERPIHRIRWMPRNNHLNGIGLCQMLKDIQEEITTIHRQRIDNATIANMKMFKVLKSAKIDSFDTYPGAHVPVDKMDDIDTLDLGTEHSTLLAEELHTNSIGEKRSGVSDYTVGRESAAIGSRATATSTLALIREGNKRFRLTITDIKEALRDIANQIIALYQQFAPGDDLEYEIFSDEEKAWVTKYFQMPPEFAKANIAIDVAALSEAENTDTSKQSLLNMMGIMQGFYQSLFQAFGVALAPEAPPQMKALAVQGAISGAELWKRLLEAFDFRDPETFAPNIEEILMLGQAADQMLGGGGIGGGIGQSPSPAGGPPMPGGGQPGQVLGAGAAGAAPTPGPMPGPSAGEPGPSGLGV